MVQRHWRQQPRGNTDDESEPGGTTYHLHNSLPIPPVSGSRKAPVRQLRDIRRRPVRYQEAPTPPELAYESYCSSTDSEAEEDARIERSMGVIRKKTAARGTEGGTKYHCDVCGVDITSTVSLALVTSELSIRCLFAEEPMHCCKAPFYAETDQLP